MIAAKDRRARQEATRQLLDALGVGIGLFGDPASVAWLTGFARPGFLDYRPFRGGPAVVICGRDSILLVVDDAAAAGLGNQDYDIRSYVGYDLDGLEAVGSRFEATFQAVLNELPRRSEVVGLEQRAFSVKVDSIIHRTFRNSRTIPIDGALDGLRQTKYTDEVGVLRSLFELVAIGHRSAQEAVGLGGREIDAWTAAESAVQRAAGRRVALGYDCVTRSRRNNAEGAPGDELIASGGSVILDLGVHDYGYWTDSCRTYGRGEQPRRQRQAVRVVRKALAAGAAMVRPGASTADIARTMKGIIEEAGYPRFPHHGGHGIGLTPFERPYITDASDDRLRPGMVLTLEPGTYADGEIAVRLEDAFLVTPDGAERMTVTELGDD